MERMRIVVDALDYTPEGKLVGMLDSLCMKFGFTNVILCE